MKGSLLLDPGLDHDHAPRFRVISIPILDITRFLIFFKHALVAH
jgi:hypothetical protein